MAVNHRAIDDWFLGYKSRPIYEDNRVDLKIGAGGKKAGTSKRSGKSSGNSGLKRGTAVTNLTSAAKKLPEVMVKIPKRTGASTGLKGIRNHLDYISRNGEVDVTTSDDLTMRGKEEVKSIADSWGNVGIPEQSNKREALNIVLSMPSGTDPQKVLNAAKNFAAEQFKNHDYAMALHTHADNPNEPEHPHVHLVLVMQDKDGKRINPRKNDLFEWRVRFAEKMREEGVECAATKRVHRGQATKAENGIVRHIKDDGRESYRHKQSAEAIAKALEAQQRPTHPFLKQVLETRNILSEDYAHIAKELYKSGHKTEARLMSQLNRQMTEASTNTKQQQQYDAHGGRSKNQNIER